MVLDPVVNFGDAIVVTAPSPATSGTSIVVDDGTRFPDPATEGAYNLSIFPQYFQPTPANSEIVRVTAKSVNTLTITRQQEGTPARTIIAGDRISMSITKKMILDIMAGEAVGKISTFPMPSAVVNKLSLHTGLTVSRTTYANLFAYLNPVKGTFTVTIATPAVVTLNSHGLNTGDAIYFTTTGALPTGLVANTIYYVTNPSSNLFNLSTSRANAIAGTKINTTGSQSGVHTLRQCPYGLGDGSTTFNLPDMRGVQPIGFDLSQTEFNTPGLKNGEKQHTLLKAELPSYNLTVTDPGHDHDGYGAGATGSGILGAVYTGNSAPISNQGVKATQSKVTGITVSSGGSGTAMNVLDPDIVMYYFIQI